MKNVKDPCISICQYDEKEICIGCSRAKSEAKSWWRMSEDEKMQVLKNIIIREQKKNSSYDHYI